MAAKTIILTVPSQFLQVHPHSMLASPYRASGNNPIILIIIIFLIILIILLVILTIILIVLLIFTSHIQSNHHLIELN